MPDYGKRARQLKDLGLINYDLRRKLNRGQKSQITKLYNEYRLLITRPSEYSSTVLSNSRADEINGSAFKIKKGRKTKIYFWGEIEQVKRHSIVVREKGQPSKSGNSLIFTNEIFDGKPKDFFSTLDRIKKMHLNEDQQITVTIGGRQWNTRWADKNMFTAYLRDWMPKDAERMSKKEGKRLKAHLLSQIQITTITVETNAKKKGNKNSRDRRGNRPV